MIGTWLRAGLAAFLLALVAVAPSAAAQDVDPDSSGFSLTSTSVAIDGVDETTLTITLVDDDIGDPVTGATIEVTGSPNLVVGSVSEDPPGTYSVGVTSTEVEVVTLSVTADGVMLSQTEDVDFINGAADADASSIANDGDAVADGSDLIVVTLSLRYADGRPVAGLTDPDFNIYHFSSGFSVGTVGEIAPGDYSVEVTNTLAETSTLFVEVAGRTFQTDLTFVPGPIDSFGSYAIVDLSDPEAIADGEDSVTILVYVADYQGNGIAGRTVTLSGVGITQSGAVEDLGGGDYRGYVTASDPETLYVTVTADGIELSDTPAANFIVGTPDATTSTVTATSPHVADGTDSSRVQIELRYANGNPLRGFDPNQIQVTGADIAPDVTYEDTPGVYSIDITRTVDGLVTLTVTAGAVQLDDQPQVGFTRVPVSAALSSASAQSPVVAGGVSLVEITVVNEAELPVTGLVDSGGLSVALSGSAGLDPGSPLLEVSPGVYTVGVTDTVAEVVDVTVTAEGVDLPSTTITFEAGSVDGAASALGVDFAQQPADGVSAASLTIEPRDQYGNAIPGRSDGAFVFSGLGGATVGLVVETSPGVYEAALTNTTAELVSVGVTVDGETFATTVDVLFVPGPVSASASTVTATTDVVLVSTATITLVDAQGNPISGLLDAAFTPQLSGFSASAGPVGETAVPGVYEVEIIDGVLETVTLTVQVNDGNGSVTLDETAAITFIGGLPDAGQSSVTPVSPVLVRETSLVTVTVRDAYGNVPDGLDSGDVAVVVSGDATWDNLMDVSPGQFSFTVTDDTVETVTVDVSVQGEALTQAAIEFYRAEIDVVASTVTATSPHAGDGLDSATIEITLVDAGGAPVTNLRDTDLDIRIDGISGLTTAAQQTGIGIYSSTYATDMPRTVAVTVVADGYTLADSPEIEFLFEPADPSYSTVAATSPHLSDGSNASTVDVWVRGAGAQVITGLLPANFTIGITGDATAGTIAEVGGEAGHYQFQVTDTTPETVTLSLSVNGVSLTDSPQIEFRPSWVSADSSQVFVMTPVLVGGNATVIVQLVSILDGTPITGATLDIALTGDGTAGAVTEIGGGNYTFEVTSATVGTVNVAVTADGILLDSAPDIEFVTDAVDASASVVSATSPHAADGIETSDVMIYLRSIDNLPLSGLAGDIEVTTDSATAGIGMVLETGTPGDYLVRINDTSLGTVVVTVVAAGVTLAPANPIEFIGGPVNANFSSLTVNPASTPVGSSVTFTLTLVDNGNHPVSGATVSLDLTGDGAGTLSGGDETGPGTGVYLFSLLGTAAGTVTATPTANGVVFPSGASVVFRPAIDLSVANSSVAASSPHVAGVEVSVVELEIRDSNGDPIAGLIDADFLIELTGDATVDAVAETVVPGLYNARISDTTAETVTVTASVRGQALAQQPQVDFVAGALDVASSSVSATSPHVAGLEPATVTLVLRDANGNAITGLDDSTFAFDLTGDAQEGLVSETATPGTYSVEVTDATVETVTLTAFVLGEELTQTPEIVFTERSVSAANSTVTATSPHQADGSDASTVTIVLRDASGTPMLVGTPALVFVTSTGSAIVGGAVEHEETISYTVGVTDTVGEEVTISVIADGITLDATATIRFNGDVSAETSIVTATSPHVADGSDASTVTLTVKDANGNPVAGLAPGAFSFTAVTGWSFGTPTEGAAGTYVAAVTSTAPGTDNVEALVDGVALQSAEIQFTPAFDVSASNSTVTASPSVVTANGTAFSQVTVLVKDSSGATLDIGPASQVQITATGSAVVGTVTGSGGIYNADVTDTVGEEVTIVVAAAGVTLQQTATVEFVPVVVDPAQSLLTATSPKTADGVDASTLTFVLADAGGTPITGLSDSDFEIQVTGSASVGTVSESATPGTYTASVTDTVAETVTVSASVLDTLLTQAPSIVFLPGAVSTATSTVTATSPHLANGADVSIVTIQPKDAFSNPITGLDLSVVVATSTGSAFVGAVAESMPGVYTVGLIDHIVEDVSVSVEVNGVEIGPAPVSFIAPTVSAANSTATASSPHLADGSDASTLTFEIKDAIGVPLSGLASGAFVISVNGDAAVGAVAETATPGTYTAAVTDGTVETVTVTASVAGIGLSQQPQIVFLSLVSAGNSTVTATTPHIANGVDTSIVTIKLVDRSGNPLAGFGNGDFVIGVTGSATVDSAVTETATAGTYAVLVTDTVEEAVTVSVTADGVLLADTASISFEENPVSASDSTIEATTPHVADAADASTVTITVIGEDGNPIEGLSAGDFQVTASGGASAGAVSPTPTPGAYSLEVTDTSAEVVTVSAVVRGVALTDQATITFTAGAPSAVNSSFTVTSPHVAGVEASTLSVYVADAFGNPLNDLQDSDFLVGLTGDATAGAFTSTGNPGSYTAQISDITAETVTVTLSVQSVALTPSQQIIFTSGTVSASLSSVTATTPHAADGTDASTVTVVLQNTNGNPVTGLTDADFSIGLSGSAAAGSVTETSTPGTYSVAVTDTVVESVDVTVTATGVTLDDQPQIDFEAGTVAAANSSISATSPHVAGNETSTVTLVVKDASSNPVTGLANGDFLIASTGDAVVGTVSESGTPGTYTASVSDNTAETVTLTAAVQGENLNQSPQIVFTTGAVSAGQSVVSATTPHVANGTNPSVVSIVVRDGNGNAVTGLGAGAFSLGLTGSATAGSVSETGTPGSYQANVTDAVPETVTLTVTVSGVVLDDQPQIVFQAIAVSEGSVSATTPHLANGSDASTVTITLQDGDGRAVTGVTAGEFAVSVTGGANAGSVSESGTAGTYTVSVTDTTAETVTVTVVARGVTLPTAQIVFVEPTVDAGDSQVSATSPHRADGQDASTVTVVLRDAAGDPITGLSASDFLLSLGGSAVAGPVSETATAGTYTAAVTDTAVETVTLSITADGVALTQTASIEFETVGIDVAAVQEAFTQATRAFLLRRMDQMLSNDPQGTSLTNRQGVFGRPAINASLEGGRMQGEFAMSLRGAQSALADFHAGTADDGATQLAAASTPQAAEIKRFDVWAEGYMSFYTDDEDDDEDEGGGDREGHFGVVYLGADYLIGESVLLGVMGQFDWSQETSAELDSDVKGTGWMIGPYASVALGERVFLDLRAAWGKSSNDASIDVFETGAPFVGSFDTSRWLLRGAISGTWDLGGVQFTPQLALSYVQESQDDYSVSDGVDTVQVPGQELTLGRLSFKPAFSYPIELDDMTLLPFVKPEILWDFDSSGDVDLDGDVSSDSPSTVRGAIELGARLATDNGITGNASFKYDGIGQSDFQGFGFTVGLSFSF